LWSGGGVDDFVGVVFVEAVSRTQALRGLASPWRRRRRGLRRAAGLEVGAGGVFVGELNSARSLGELGVEIFLDVGVFGVVVEALEFIGVGFEVESSQ